MNAPDGQLEKIARVPVLLVASDYDGTLAPIVADPSHAKPCREAIVALRTLATLPNTHVAVISGRALRDLAELTGAPDDIHLVGSHGSEFDLDYATSLSPESLQLRQHLEQELAEIASRDVGFSVEFKPASVAFHYRNADQDISATAISEVMAGPAALEGVYTKHGKKVLELSVVATHKGKALEIIRQRVGASAVMFLGDDRTDEDGFATLTGPDVGVKVGPGQSCASHQVPDTQEVARLLARLSELRADWLAGAQAVPIEQHSMLSDQRTTALVTPDARIVWYCLPAVDSPALFAELLGGPAAGHFTVEPTHGRSPTGQKYLGNSLVLQTTWDGCSLTDFLDCTGGRPDQRAGRSDLVRIVEGETTVQVDFAPRLDFGRVPTKLVPREGGLEIGDTPDPIVLRSPGVSWTLVNEGDHQSARAELDLSNGSVVLELRYGSGSMREGSRSASDRNVLTQRFWSSWAERLTLPVVEPDLVRTSALVLKGLCYGPTGAIVAAATTSLPEHVGGVRNWDYRYCWLRDAAMTASALVRLGSTSEAMQYLDWVLGVIDHCDSPERLRPLYSVTGSTLGAEGEIAELAGYRGSRPVRVGNSAARQVQLDVFGPVVDLVAQLVEADAPLSSNHWRLVEATVQAVERRWREPDHGIWEIRRPRRHHVHSKIMCWLTVDRAISVASHLLDRKRDDWLSLRENIADDVLRHGYKPQMGAFTAAYDGTDLDAATLFIGLSGLLPADDPRFTGTVDVIEQALLEGPTVYRYRADDGLPGHEGGFFICASWLVNAYVLMGRNQDADELFRQIVSLKGPTGMLSEQYGPDSKRALGNVPQAYSHIGVIENAILLSEAGQS